MTQTAPEQQYRIRVARTAEALYSTSRARRSYRCNGHMASEPHMIQAGDLHVASALPPHSEIGNTHWWHMRLCMDCAPVEAVGEDWRSAR